MTDPKTNFVEYNYHLLDSPSFGHQLLLLEIAFILFHFLSTSHSLFSFSFVTFVSSLLSAFLFFSFLSLSLHVYLKSSHCFSIRSFFECSHLLLNSRSVSFQSLSLYVCFLLSTPSYSYFISIPFNFVSSFSRLYVHLSFVHIIFH
jgi:hypothetical protein